MKGAILKADKDIRKSVTDFLMKALDKKCFDAVMLPVMVPAGDSFAYVLVRDQELLESSYPLSPIIAVQGARAVSSLTRLGKGNRKIAVLMRPCELRATVELAKLQQVNLDNITLLSIDCPGAVPLSDFLANPQEQTKEYCDSIREWKIDKVRPICETCVNFTSTSEDLHIGILGAEKTSLFLIPSTERGAEILSKLGLEAAADLKSRATAVKKIADEREKNRQELFQTLKTNSTGIDGLLEVFKNCISCRNCMRVCPVCYCRQCYFDSAKHRYPFDDYFNQARERKSLRIPPDTLLFHVSRMAHIGLSCVSCGVCEDACPMDIPIARLYSLVASECQKLFKYVSGLNRDESHPLATFEQDELHEFED